MKSKSVIILGPPRSGTTLLGRIFSSHASFSYVEEPNVIWRYKNWARLGHEEFEVDDASADVVSHIRKNILRKAVNVGFGENFLVEKTPANSLRPEFVKRIFPDGKYIVLMRHPDDVIPSIENKWLYESDSNAARLNDMKVGRQIRLQAKKFTDISFSDLPFYFKVAFSEILFSIFGRKRRYWGPQYDGYRLYLDEPVLCQAARQWIKCTRSLIAFNNKNPDVMLVFYDRLISNQHAELSKIEDFLEIHNGSLTRSLIVSTGVQIFKPNCSLDLPHDIIAEIDNLIIELAELRRIV